jgi:L-aminopeptidase/D-esterase-like protein
VRTSVTAILPRGKSVAPVFAGFYSFNGNGEMTGIHWVEESGFLEGPITNTHSVGVVRDATIEWENQNKSLRASRSQHILADADSGRDL